MTTITILNSSFISHSAKKNPTRMMRVAALLLSCLLPLMQGAIVGMPSDSVEKPSEPFELDLMDPLTGAFKKIVDFLPDGRPTCLSGVRNDNTMVYGAVSSPQARLNIIDLATGKIQEGPLYDSFLFTNIAFDNVTKQTFVIARVNSSSSYLYEVLPGLLLRQIAPSEIPRVTAYSSSKHIFFLASQSIISGVGTVGPREGEILFSVPVPIQISALVFDDTFGVLYAWGLDGPESVVLVSVDYTTGKILKTFLKSPTLFPVYAACINKEGTTIYSAWEGYDFAMQTMDLSSGKTTQVSTARLAFTMAWQ